jgi:hypothetical protein
MDNRSRDKIKYNQLNGICNKDPINTANEIDEDVVEQAIAGNLQAINDVGQARRKYIPKPIIGNYVYVTDPQLISTYISRYSQYDLFNVLFLGDVYADGSAVVNVDTLLKLASGN